MEAYLGLGSNLGDRRANLAEALRLLSERVEVVAVSSVYDTAPVGVGEQPRFLNAVCRIESDVGPLQLLTLAKGIEAGMGRDLSLRNEPRVIDIDIIFYGDAIIESPELTVPHPRMNERAFVLIPLAEIAPDVVHPVAGRSIAELAADVDGRDGVEKLDGL